MRYIFCAITCLILILGLSWVAMSSIPPHPRIERMIKEGKISPPYFLIDKRSAFERGINAGPSHHAVQFTDFHDKMSPSYKALAILIEFSDHPASVSPVYFDSLLFDANGMSTLRNYYAEISYGTLDIVTVNLPSSVGWTVVPQTYSYYVAGSNGLGPYPQNAQKLAEDAVAAVDPYVDFSQYDNDHDGYVDALYVIHSGSGAEITGNINDIYSHQWQTSTPKLVDGVYAFIYAMEPEYWLTPGDMTCGVFVHNTGHMIFGLPDLWDTENDSRGLGMWSFMAKGSWGGQFHMGDFPTHPDAWSRCKMGFVASININANATGVSIPAVQDSPKVVRLWTNGASGSEYFLLENRQKVGYDMYLPGTGLCIYHIDENEPGNDFQWYPGFTNFGHYKVALEQADGLWQLEHNVNSGDSGDAYPGLTNNRDFSNTSIPDSKDYNLLNTYVGVSNISNSGPIMTVDLFVQSLFPQIDIHPTTFTLNVIPGDTTSRFMTINNTGLGDLVYQISKSLPNLGGMISPQEYIRKKVFQNPTDYTQLRPKRVSNVRDGNPRELNQGGPDAYGYKWKDSDDPTGPIFDWVDIRSVGTQIPMTGDESNTGPYPIGFPFTFYGNTFSSFRITTDGWVSFTNHNTDYNNNSLPSTASPENLLAVFWDDLVFASNKSYYYYNGNQAIIQFDNVRSIDDPGSSYSFEIVLYPSGKIVYQYLTMNGNVDSSTVGIQNATKDIGLNVVFNTPYIHNNLAIEFTNGLTWLSYSPPSGVVFPGQSQNVKLSFDLTRVDIGDYTANLLITSNANLQDSIIVPLLLHVGIPAPMFSALPQTIGYGDINVGNSKIDSVSVTNTGTAVLSISGVLSDDEQFTVIPTSVTLPRDATRNFYITFTPSSHGIKRGHIIFLHNGVTSPDTLSVSGVGREAVFNMTPLSLDIDTVQLGSRRTDSVLVSNVGNVVLNISSVTSTDSQIIVQPTLAIIPPSFTRTIRVTFAPIHTGKCHARIIFVHNGLVSSDTMDVSGVGVSSLNVQSGWNLVSLSLHIDDRRKAIIFPSAVSAAFMYQGTYVAKDTLDVGPGYWVKFNQATIVNLQGISLAIDTLILNKGWNIIGSISTPLKTSKITSIPGNIITSNFFRYQGAYLATDTIKPGFGYWLKVNQAGKLILSSSTLTEVPARLIKIVDDGDIPPPPPATDELHITKEIPTVYALEQAYPNPFNPTTTIRYQLPAESKVSLKVFNLLGEVVVVLKDEIQSGGYKSIEWNASNLASEIYYYRLEASSLDDPSKIFTQVRKMILIK